MCGRRTNIYNKDSAAAVLTRLGRSRPNYIVGLRLLCSNIAFLEMPQPLPYYALPSSNWYMPLFSQLAGIIDSGLIYSKLATLCRFHKLIPYLLLWLYFGLHLSPLFLRLPVHVTTKALRRKVMHLLIVYGYLYCAETSVAHCMQNCCRVRVLPHCTQLSRVRQRTYFREFNRNDEIAEVCYGVNGRGPTQLPARGCFFP